MELQWDQMVQKDSQDLANIMPKLKIPELNQLIPSLENQQERK